MPLDPFGNRPDNINPSHYRKGSVEAIDAMKACLTPEEFRGYLKGCALKYLWRERHKGKGDDILKALWYVERISIQDSEPVGRDFENEAEMTKRYAEWVKGLQDASDGAD
jgi:hypothetical protein